MKQLLLTITLLFCINLFAQNKTIDSLKLVLKNAKHDTTRITTFLAIGEQIYTQQPDSAMVIWIKAQNLTEKNLKSFPPTHPEYALFKKHLATSLNNIGIIYKNQGDIPKALEYYSRSLKIEEEIGNKEGVASSLNNIGSIYHNQGDIPKALEYFSRSLKIREKIGNKEGIATSLNNIGIIYKNQGDIPKALEYYSRSLKIQEEIGDKNGIAYSLNNIGDIYKNQGDIPKALEYLSRSLKIQEEIGNKEGLAYSLNNIGAIYQYQGDFPKVLEYFGSSIKIREKIGNKQGIAISLNSIGGIYIRQKNFNKALEYSTKSMQLSKELGFPGNIRNAAKQLSAVYKATGNYKLALENYELFVQMRDSITNEETKKASIKSQFQYQYEKKAATDSVANAKANEIKNAQIAKQKAEIKAKRNQKYGLYGGLALVLLFAGFVYNRLKVTQKQKVIIETQKHLVELKHKEITDSINYAERIQRSFLATQEMLDKYLGAPSPKVIASEESVVTSSSIEENTSHPVTSSSPKNEGVSRSNNQYEILEYKPDKMPVGKHDKENEPFTLHTLQLQKGDVIYTLTDGFADQFGGKQGKKYMIKNVKELLLSIAHLPMPEQEQKLAEEFADWKGKNEQVDDVCVIGVKI